MKHTLLIALLGATVTFATPSLSLADHGQKFKNGLDHKHQQANARRDRDRRNNGDKFTAKPPKPHRIVKQIRDKVHNKDKRHNKGNRHNNVKKHHNKNRYVDKHRNNKRDFQRNHRSNQRNHHNEPSFSISWDLGNSRIEYGNVARGYQQPVYNRHAGKRIYKRIHRQANRIQRGVENGQLVRREVKHLRREQRHIKNTLSSYKRDSRLNRYERSKLNQLLDVASNNIHRKSNNRLTRYNKPNHRYNNQNYAQF